MRELFFNITEKVILFLSLILAIILAYFNIYNVVILILCLITLVIILTFLLNKKPL